MIENWSFISLTFQTYTRSRCDRTRSFLMIPLFGLVLCWCPDFDPERSRSERIDLDHWRSFTGSKSIWHQKPFLFIEIIDNSPYGRLAFVSCSLLIFQDIRKTKSKNSFFSMNSYPWRCCLWVTSHGFLPDIEQKTACPHCKKFLMFKQIQSKDTVVRDPEIEVIDRKWRFRSRSTSPQAKMANTSLKFDEHLCKNDIRQFRPRNHRIQIKYWYT